MRSRVSAVQLQGVLGPSVATLEGVVLGVVETEVVGELSTHHHLLHEAIRAGRVLAVGLGGKHTALCGHLDNQYNK